MRVLLTGATGFVGSHLVRIVLEEGCEVHAVIRPGADTRRIDPMLAHIRRVPGDLCDPAGLDAEIRQLRPELCLHLAWTTEPGRYQDSLENLELLHGSCRLAAALAEAGCRRLIGVGTGSEYDTTLGYLSEDSPLRPRSLYAAAKASLGLVLGALQHRTGLEVAWPRLFHLYGPHEHERRLVPSVILALVEKRMAAVTAGTQVRDYLHVEDVARALWAVGKSALTGPVNVGSGQPTPVRDVISRLGALLGRPELIDWRARPVGEAEPPVVCADTRRLVESTSWAPRYDLETGLRQTVDWWRRHLAARTA